MRRSHLAGAALLTLLVAQQARAQASRPDTILVVEIVGVAQQGGPGVDRKVLPYALQTAGGKDLDAARSDNLSDFMGRQLTGVNVNEISGSPFQNDVTFRGFRASPVLGTAQGLSVYLDGVRVNEPFGDVVNWDMLPEAAIDSILLVPGSNPLYGLNTLGGALALRSKSGLSHPGLEADVSYGSGGQRRSDLAYGVADEHWHAFLAATLFDDLGWRDHSAGRLGNVFLKLGRSEGATEWEMSLLGGASRLIGNGLLPSYRWQDGGLRGGLYEEQPRAAYTFPDETRNRLHQASFKLSHHLDAGGELTAGAYVRNSRRDTVNGDVSEAYADYIAEGGQGEAPHTAALNTTSTRQDSHGLNANLSGTLAAHQWIAGATFDASRVRFAQFAQAADFSAERAVLAEPGAQREAGTSVSGTSRSLGLYLSDTWRVAAGTHLTASARLNHARVSNILGGAQGLQPQETFTYRKLNPSIGLAHEAGAGVTLFANVAQSNRVPTVIELGCADPAQPCRLPVGLQSDPYLKQVVARTVEAGARRQTGQGDSVSLALYRTVNRDDILFRSAGLSQQGYFSNFARTRHQGMDLSATHKFGSLTSRLSYSYLEAVYDADGRLFTGARNVQVRPGTRIAGLPRHTLKLGADWKLTASLSVGAELLAVSDLPTQGNEDGLRADTVDGQAPQYADWRVRGYALLNLRASYRPDQRWELFVRVNNVADRRHASYGAVATDMFPNGQLLRPQDEAATARFVAPGAPRTVTAGLRYHF